tara:strand:- start:27 stop:512 length:486 start_codon:yes stop_codon:yes gene_type:complete
MPPVDLLFLVIFFILFLKISKFKPFQQIPLEYFVFFIFIYFAFKLHLHQRKESHSVDDDNHVHVDGTSIAIDKQAFENLNKIVNDLFQDGEIVCPGNLVIKQHLLFYKNGRENGDRRGAQGISNIMQELINRLDEIHGRFNLPLWETLSPSVDDEVQQFGL